MRPRGRAGWVGLGWRGMLCGITGLVVVGWGALAVGQTPPFGPPAAGAGASLPPEEGEQPPPSTVPAPSTIPLTPAPPVPESQMAPPPEAALKPKVVREAAKPPPAPKRALYNAAVLQALDKVTTETLRFEAPLNRPIRYKGLIFTVHTCQVEPPGVLPPAEAHLQIISQPVVLAGRATPQPREVYRGWMYANTPGVHPFEHPVYDVWLIACKTASPVNAPRR